MRLEIWNKKSKELLEDNFRACVGFSENCVE